MKNIINGLIWINRYLIILLLLSIILIFIKNDFYIISAILAFFIGFFHVLFALSLLFYINKLAQKELRSIIIYLSIVALYFISYFLLFEFLKIQFRQSVFPFIFGLLPIFLSLFWTYILESIKKEI